MRWRQIYNDEKRSIQNDDVNFKVKPRDNVDNSSFESIRLVLFKYKHN